jgi:hypothetical protein
VIEPGLLAQLQVALQQLAALGVGLDRVDAARVFLGADMAQGLVKVGVGLPTTL